MVAGATRRSARGRHRGHDRHGAERAASRLAATLPAPQRPCRRRRRQAHRRARGDAAGLYRRAAPRRGGHLRHAAHHRGGAHPHHRPDRCDGGAGAAPYVPRTAMPRPGRHGRRERPPGRGLRHRRTRARPEAVPSRRSTRPTTPRPLAAAGGKPVAAGDWRRRADDAAAAEDDADAPGAAGLRHAGQAEGPGRPRGARRQQAPRELDAERPLWPAPRPGQERGRLSLPPADRRGNGAPVQRRLSDRRSLGRARPARACSSRPSVERPRTELPPAPAEPSTEHQQPRPSSPPATRKDRAGPGAADRPSASRRRRPANQTRWSRGWPERTTTRHLTGLQVPEPVRQPRRRAGSRPPQDPAAAALQDGQLAGRRAARHRCAADGDRQRRAEEAAVKGDATAQFEIATRFAEGNGVPQDQKQAFAWYERAAMRGLASAQFRLGAYYERGIGVTADAERAKVWYRRAADQGHVRAMHNLGVLRRRTRPGAGRLCRRLALVQGGRQARAISTASSISPRSTRTAAASPRTWSKSYMWFALAARSGDAGALRRLEEIKAQLDPLEIGGGGAQAGGLARRGCGGSPRPGQPVGSRPAPSRGPRSAEVPDWRTVSILRAQTPACLHFAGTWCPFQLRESSRPLVGSPSSGGPLRT